MALEPMETPRRSVPKKTLVGLIGATAAALATASVTTWEGKRNDPYRDIVGIPTVCYGDTANVTMGKRVSNAECDARLESQMMAHAEPVLRCTPGLLGRPAPLAAAVSFAYNIGPSAYCRSSTARAFNAGNYRAGCDAMLRWNMAGGKVVRGLQRRREAERAICLKDVGE